VDAVAPQLPSAPQGTPAPLPPPLGVAIFGLGRAGTIHLTNVLKTRRLRIRYLVDCDEKKLEQVRAAQYLDAECRCVVSSPEAVKAVMADDAVSLVVVAAPSAHHEGLVCAALAGGRHVLCEKPVALSCDAVQRCYDLAKQHQRVLLCAFNRRFDPSFSALTTAAQQGQVGTLHTVNTVSRDSPKPSLDYLSISGGIYHDCIVHDVDMLCSIVGSLPTTAFAMGSCFDPAIAALGDHDTVVATLRFPGGVLGHIDISREAVYGYDQRVEVLGNKGALQAANQRPHQMMTSGKDGSQQVPIFHSFPSRYHEAYLRQLEYFIRLVDGTETTDITKEHVLGVTRVVEALEHSAKTGQAVTIQY